MIQNGWHNVTRKKPCPICEKSDWCSVNAKSGNVCCRRRSDFGAVHRIDKAGVDYWFHVRNAPSRDTFHSFHSKTTNSIPIQDEMKHAVYTSLLSKLTLFPIHFEALKGRSLPDAKIVENGYRSMPPFGRSGVATDLVKEFGQEICLSIPGIYHNEGLKKFTIHGPVGLCIPVRNVLGQIVAIKIRTDADTTGNRYFYLSSKGRGGAGPGARVHVPLHSNPGNEIVRVTEGEIKADIATALTDILTISIPGVTFWRNAREVLTDLQAKTVRLALDADARVKPEVAKALKNLGEYLVEGDFSVEVEQW